MPIHVTRPLVLVLVLPVHMSCYGHNESSCSPCFALWQLHRRSHNKDLLGSCLRRSFPSLEAKEEAAVLLEEETGDLCEDSVRHFPPVIITGDSCLSPVGVNTLFSVTRVSLKAQVSGGGKNMLLLWDECFRVHRSRGKVQPVVASVTRVSAVLSSVYN